MSGWSTGWPVFGMQTDAEPVATRIVAVRHGQTAWNVDTRIQGHLDIALNATGRWQAARLAEALTGEGLSAVYSSDLLRAADTAALIGSRCGLPVKLEAGLRERCFGEFEGRTWAEIEHHWPADSERWRTRDLSFAPRGGESLPVFNERVLVVCRRVALLHPGECIALVAHGGVMDCLRRAATHVGLTAPRTWPLVNAAVNRLLFAGDGFTMVGWGDTSHLAESEGAVEPLDPGAGSARQHAGSIAPEDHTA